MAQIIRFPTSYDPLLTKKQVAQHLAVSTKSLDRWVKRRGLPSMMVGGQRRFRLSAVETWIEDQQS